MKTFKLNGFDVVVCCDQMHVYLDNGWYYIKKPFIKSSATIWEDEFGLCRIDEDEPLTECPHCDKEIVIK